MGFVIKLICSQCLKKRECSFPVGEAETVGLPMKVREIGWLGFPRQRDDTHMML